MKLNEKTICEILERFANKHSLAKGGNIVVKVDQHSTGMTPKPGCTGFKYEDSNLLQSILEGASQLLWFFWREGYSITKQPRKTAAKVR